MQFKSQGLQLKTGQNSSLDLPDVMWDLRDHWKAGWTDLEDELAVIWLLKLEGLSLKTKDRGYQGCRIYSSTSIDISSKKGV